LKVTDKVTIPPKSLKVRLHPWAPEKRRKDKMTDLKLNDFFLKHHKREPKTWVLNTFIDKMIGWSHIGSQTLHV